MAVKCVAAVAGTVLGMSLLLGGCASNAGPSGVASDTSATPSSDTAAPNPDPSSDPTSVSIASPLRIPLPTDQLQGDVYASGLPRLKAKIAGACGGSQCVSVAKVGEGSALEVGQLCDTILRVEDKDFDEKANEAFVKVLPGGTITIVVNVRCEDLPPTSPPTGTSTTDSTGASLPTDDPSRSSAEP